MTKKKTTYRYSYWLSQNDGVTWENYDLAMFHSLIWPHISNTILHSFYCKIQAGHRLSVGPWLATATRHSVRAIPTPPKGRRL